MCVLRGTVVSSVELFRFLPGCTVLDLYANTPFIVYICLLAACVAAVFVLLRYLRCANSAYRVWDVYVRVYVLGKVPCACAV